MNIKKSMSIALAVLTVGGVATTSAGYVNAAQAQNPVQQDSSKGPGYYDATYKIESFNGVAKISYVPGYGIAVWTSPKDGKVITNKILKHGSSWKLFGKTSVNGQIWYNVGGNQWIQAKYTTLTSTNNKKPVNNDVFAERNRTIIVINRIAKINYKPGYGIAVWTSPTSGKTTGQYLPTGSRWKVSAMVNNGILWYQVGTNQWIKAMYTI